MDLGVAPPTRTVRWRARRRFNRIRRGVREEWHIRTDQTYRRLARTYHLPDGSRRVYCYHVRKTAGTSLYLSFMALGGEDPAEVWRRITASRLPRTITGDYIIVANSRRLLSEGTYFYGRSHRSADRQHLPSDTFTVTVLRDPVARVRSYYDYLMTGDAPDTPGRLSARERGLVVDGFDAFLQRVPTRDLLNQIATFSSRLDVSEAADRIATCSCVLFTEDFATGIGRLARRLELPLVEQRARVTSVRSTLDDGQVERLRTRLEPEYELFRRLARAGIRPESP